MLKSLLRLTKHSTIYGLGHILGRSIGLILLPIHTNYLPPSEYALYIYGYAFIPFIATFYSAGINSAQLRYFLLAKERAEKRNIFTTSFIGTVFIAIAITAILWFFSREISQLIFGDAQYNYLLKISCGILFFDALLLLLFNILRAEEKSVLFISYNILFAIINIFFNILFIVYFKSGIIGIFWANLIASATLFFILIFRLRKYFTNYFSRKLFIKLIKFGFPVIPSIMAMVILTMVDRFIIRYIMGDEAAGLYGAGYRLGMFMSLIVTAFRYAWQPFYLSTAKEDDDAKEVFARVLTYFIFFCGAIFLVISLFINEIVRFKISGITIFGEEYWSGTIIVPLILASYVFYGIYLNFQIGVYLENKTKYLAYTTLLSAALNIIINFLLIPQLGILGAAWATLISYIFMAFSLYFYANKLYPIKYEWLRISKIGVTSVLLFIVGTSSYPDKPAAFKLLFILAYFVVLYFIGFYEKQEIKKITNFIKGIPWQS